MRGEEYEEYEGTRFLLRRRKLCKEDVLAMQLGCVNRLASASLADGCKERS